MLIDGGGDMNVATSLLEASNLVVLKVLYLPLSRIEEYVLGTYYLVTYHLFRNRNHLSYTLMQIWEFMDKAY